MTDIRVDGEWKAVSAVEVYVEGQWRRVTRSEAYVGGAWKTGETYTDPLSVSLSTSEAYAVGSYYVTSDPVTATPSGGLGPYTYSWVNVTGDGSVDSPTSATSTFSWPGSSSGTFRCTVTDSLGASAVSLTVTVTFIDLGGFF